ncbi:MAG: flagellar protein FlaG [Rhodocyclaceae bacterium]
MQVPQVAASPGTTAARTVTAPQAGAQSPQVTPPVGTQPAPADAVQPTSTVEQVRNAVAQVQKAYAPLAQDLEFSIDKDTGKTVVKLVDSKTNTVLRQIPSEEILSIAKALDKMQGLLVNQKE